jgi:D,D-heptose 1,7-bisphosphate phosphatase
MSNKAIFLDRDDTLIQDPGYINHPDQVKLRDGAAEALVQLKRMGYKLIVVTNQSGVARGVVSEDVLSQVHNRLKQLLAEKEAYLDGIYYCPYHPDGVIAKYRKESDWRKPNPGMLLAAASEMDIDLSESWMIGNSGRDIEAGLRAGCRTILINRSFNYKQPEPGQPNPDYKAVNIKEAVNVIKKYHHSSGKASVEVGSAPASNSQPASQATEKTAQQETIPASQGISGERLEQLLGSILEQLRSMQRDRMFSEFSIVRLIAGIVQIIVLFCLLISIWFLISPSRQDNSVLIAIGFAMVLQVMALTFYVMRGQK